MTGHWVLQQLTTLSPSKQFKRLMMFFLFDAPRVGIYHKPPERCRYIYIVAGKRVHSTRHFHHNTKNPSWTEYIFNVTHHIIKSNIWKGCWWVFKAVQALYRRQCADGNCTHSLCWVWGNARWASRCFWMLCYEETPCWSPTVCAHGAWWTWSESWRPNLEHKKTISGKNNTKTSAFIFRT